MPCLIVESRVSDGPVEVVSGQCVAVKLAVVDHPPVTFIVPFSPDDRDLVRKELGGVLQEPGSKKWWSTMNIINKITLV